MSLPSSLSLSPSRPVADRARWFACRLAFSSSRRGKMRSYMYTWIQAHVTQPACVDVTRHTPVCMYVDIDTRGPRLD